METIYAAILGLIEGITEFLPISSSGHMILADHFMGFKDVVGHDVAASFEIIIQLGAILAVVLTYPERFVGLVWPPQQKGLGGIRGLALLAITTIPAGLVGLAAHHFIKERLFSPWTVAAGLAVGGLGILAVERYRPQGKTESVDQLGWKEALGVGLFQCLALWPGMSRSASTIIGGMLLGLDRKTATTYSFFAAVPLMIAATGFEMYKMIKEQHLFAHSQMLMVAVGFGVALVSALLAVKWLIRFLGRHTLAPFGWYRLALALVVVWALWRYQG